MQALLLRTINRLMARHSVVLTAFAAQRDEVCVILSIDQCATLVSPQSSCQCCIRYQIFEVHSVVLC
jgi:hypothetical protein